MDIGDCLFADSQTMCVLCLTVHCRLPDHPCHQGSQQKSAAVNGSGRAVRHAVVQALVIVASAAFAGEARVKHDGRVYVGAELADADLFALRAAHIEGMCGCVAIVAAAAAAAVG